ncbi:Protein-N(5)-glutamine methyltransferase PrmC [Indibacter alkaliphilus LW1]|uniref:Release factor glutamine methyltransferase n=1 Tax=Indibacter alkaliphilus (strain CCUG 57479 / KCTC 22604 / LW1) TaxID=1189612 RepID=S2DA64_INDAL|nr:peptide chain release factor N(5)-glutamine methyltransferase [Indibacter alkaliphilus]EOZ96087.1 Protein-N(5)-glutamine methyltransferase PrmC [Indibacter alkaliphilus LW1]
MKIRDLFNHYKNELQQIYPKEEAESLVFWLFEDFLQAKRQDLLNNTSVERVPEKLSLAIEALLQGKPIQYITGKAPFYGREFLVNSAVLIPRNETEELVHLIIQENQKEGLKILDIGTGSGCIPITLSLEILGANVSALDVSETALEIASQNAELLKAEVQFLLCDILKEDIQVPDLDIIVSNPPYVRNSEKMRMHQNVLDHEPHLALFVYDEDPLLFYRIIAEKARKVLKPGGKLYFEINEVFGKETKILLEGKGFSSVAIINDLNGKERIISAVFENQ